MYAYNTNYEFNLIIKVRLEKSTEIILRVNAYVLSWLI